MANDTITCYSYNGVAYDNNVKCPNSDSCCATAAQCRDDRLCNSNDDRDIIVRAVCVYKPWTLATCAQICLYDDKRGYLPRVNVCSDGSYCCDNDTTCCVDKAGFFLTDGVITGRANDTTTTTSSATPTTSLTSSTSPASATASATDTSSSGLSSGGKIGVGVGVAVGGLAILALALFWFLWRRRKNAAAPPQQQPDYTTPPPPVPVPAEQPKPYVEMSTSPAETTSNPAPWFGAHEIGSSKPATQPVELSS
ncbi:hypothetical protein ASPWEDRAFT_45222 [Aspergillus wentii DTO 134E9]|uniref:Mid2 domain-containing protein n=1 Tax=Aspergillus wentii DTO 134E9 TaxID=1073089 RepID=A0A1L9R8K2_ASPWE|nr:uncharacterized protein ASPWEDRAFT_45222 [Aspergillus wentii DTO 134E9]KAI9925077.1 hypothetical protein MW887_006485 [Aspergillus wentii]OJJ31255.1 hypothetical protein ASPWEDRAFT_45222 [Aspergillus wentii DTO 134E9]